MRTPRTLLVLLGLASAARIVTQYEQRVLVRFGRVPGRRDPGFRLIIPFVDVLRRVSLRIVTMPIRSRGIITHDNVAEREKRAKIINAEGESLAAALGEVSDTMMAHPLALQLRNLRSLVEIGVDKNTTVVFPAPLMTTIAELDSFLPAERDAALPVVPRPSTPVTTANGTAPNGTAADRTP